MDLDYKERYREYQLHMHQAEGLSSGEFTFTNQVIAVYKRTWFRITSLDGDSTIDVYENLNHLLTMIFLDVLEKHGIKNPEYTHEKKLTGALDLQGRYKFKLIPPEGDWSNAAFLALDCAGKALLEPNLPLPPEAGRCENPRLKAFGVTLNCYEDVDSLSNLQ